MVLYDIYMYWNQVAVITFMGFFQDQECDQVCWNIVEEWNKLHKHPPTSVGTKSLTLQGDSGIGVPLPVVPCVHSSCV